MTSALFGISPLWSGQILHLTGVNKEEREWMNQLCCLIQVEKDPAKLAVLVRELHELLWNSGHALHVEVRDLELRG